MNDKKGPDRNSLSAADHLIMLVLFIIPVFQTFWLSFRDWNGISAESKFIGFGNFQALLKSDGLRQTIRNTLELFALGTVLINGIALAAAVSLDRKAWYTPAPTRSSTSCHGAEPVVVA
jgi:ABC-type sugar transport system permease subunit